MSIQRGLKNHGMRIFEEKTGKIESDLRNIVEILLLNGTLIMCPGLVHGKMGVSFSFMLNEYLRICHKYDQWKAYVREDKTKKYYDPDGISYLDENGKINWDIIRRFMPRDVEIFVKNRFKMLNEHEVRLCCLLFFGVTKKNIAHFLPYKQASIKSITCRIKRKTNMKDINELFILIIEYIA